MSKVLIVGAGFYGATVAHQLDKAGHECYVIDRRNHIAGNAYTRFDPETNCHEHVYGAHIFHTNNASVWEFVNRFGTFNTYRHRIKAWAAGTLYSFPINLMTLYQVFGTATPRDGAMAVATDCIPCIGTPQNLEQHCLHHVGRRLYELFIRDYTAKQWNTDPRDLPAAIIKRLPVRFTFSDDYFEDAFQGIPVNGYTSIINNMLTGIPIELCTEFTDDVEFWTRHFDVVVYSGSIDELFGLAHGRLAYRSLRFETTTYHEQDYQGTAVVNFCDAKVPYTRSIEHGHFVNGSRLKTLVTLEYPADNGQRFYPINTPDNEALYLRYKALAREALPNLVVGGRLGSYRYIDMHQAIASGMAHARQLAEELR